MGILKGLFKKKEQPRLPARFLAPPLLEERAHVACGFAMCITQAYIRGGIEPMFILTEEDKQYLYSLIRNGSEETFGEDIYDELDISIEGDDVTYNITISAPTVPSI